MHDVQISGQMINQNFLPIKNVLFLNYFFVCFLPAKIKKGMDIYDHLGISGI